VNIKNNRMNWGTRVFIGYAAGVCFISYFVIRSMMLSTEMVEPDYYNKELAFNEHIQGVNNARLLINPIIINSNESQIEVIIDSVTAQSMQKGEIHFYNPASEKADKKMTLIPSNGKYIFNKSIFIKGKYYVRVSFEYQQKPFFTEVIIFIK